MQRCRTLLRGRTSPRKLGSFLAHKELHVVTSFQATPLRSTSRGIIARTPVSLVVLLSLCACSGSEDEAGGETADLAGSASSSGGASAADGGASASGGGGGPSGGQAGSGGNASGGLSGSGASPGSGSSPGAGGADGGSGGVSATGGTDGSGGGSAPPPLCEQSITDTNKAIAEEAMTRLFIETDASAFTEFWADPYLQHNPVADSGVDAFWSFFENQVAAGSPLYSMERVMGECDLVLFHGSWGTGAMFDMMRVQDGKLVEHWDAPSSGLGGTTMTGDPSLSAASKQLVLEFTDHLISGDPDAAGSYLSDTFVSHNGDIAGSGPSFVSWWNGRGVTYAEVHHLIADGEMVFTMTEGTDDGQGYGFYDLYRVVSGEITEHWDGGRAMQDGVSGLGIF